MSNSLGTITPVLVAQEALPILADRFPFLGNFVTDFSNENVKLGQTVYSRIPQLQSSQAFDLTNGYVATTGTLTDVPVTISNHQYSAVSFSDAEVNSTDLNLVQQFASSLATEVGVDIMSKVAALFTTGNYSNSVAVPSGSLITRANGIVAAKKTLDVAKAPQDSRFFINSPQSESELYQDTSLVQLTFGGAGISKDGLPTVHGFDFGTYTSLPTTSNLIAVAAQKSAVVVACRAPEMPNENSNVLIPGSITNVSDPKTGFTIQIRESYDMIKGKYQVTYVWMYGVAVGNANTLVRITRAGG